MKAACMTVRAVAAALPLLALVACASPEAPAGDQQVSQSRQCERGESQTGSMLSKKVCGPAATEEERQRTIEEAQRIKGNMRGAAPKGG